MSVRIELAGKRFARLFVTGLADRRQMPSGQSVTYWSCKCDCGSETEVSSQNLRNGKVRSCGCLNADLLRARALDYTGKRFGRLVVIRRGETLSDEATTWICACDCGVEKQVRTALLSAGQALSCGCLRNQMAAQRRWVGDSISYLGMHDRIRIFRGPARNYRCVDCDERARDWSYDGGDPNEKRQVVNGSDLAYSLDPSRYSPRCPKCHRKYDVAAREAIA